MITAIRSTLTLSAAVAIIMSPGCDKGATTHGPKADLPTQVYVEDLVSSAPARRAGAAQALANLPAKQLREHVPALEKALRAEQDPQVRAAIQAALDKAR